MVTENAWDKRPYAEEMKVTLMKEFTFEASHVLPKHKGKCARLHGHSWKLKVYVEGYVDSETGFVVDYGELKELVNHHIIEKVDHQHLGCDHVYQPPDVDMVTGKILNVRLLAAAALGAIFYPSSENLVKAFVRILQPLVKELGHPWQEIKLVCLEIDETCTSAAMWRE